MVLVVDVAAGAGAGSGDRPVAGGATAGAGPSGVRYRQARLDSIELLTARRRAARTATHRGAPITDEQLRDAIAEALITVHGMGHVDASAAAALANGSLGAALQAAAHHHRNGRAGARAVRRRHPHRAPSPSATLSPGSARVRRLARQRGGSRAWSPTKLVSLSPSPSPSPPPLSPLSPPSGSINGGSDPRPLTPADAIELGSTKVERVLFAAERRVRRSGGPAHTTRLPAAHRGPDSSLFFDPSVTQHFRKQPQTEIAVAAARRRGRSRGLAAAAAAGRGLGSPSATAPVVQADSAAAAARAPAAAAAVAHHRCYDPEVVRGFLRPRQQQHPQPQQRPRPRTSLGSSGALHGSGTAGSAEAARGSPPQAGSVGGVCTGEPVVPEHGSYTFRSPRSAQGGAAAALVRRLLRPFWRPF
eukprot:COSAG01_NODE_940_length_12584_cov_7.454218_3_plen_417_part_00